MRDMAQATRDTTRQVGPEGQGSPGDVRDRFRNVYRPGANPPPLPPGIQNPLPQIMQLLQLLGLSGPQSPPTPHYRPLLSPQANRMMAPPDSLPGYAYGGVAG